MTTPSDPPPSTPGPQEIVPSWSQSDRRSARVFAQPLAQFIHTEFSGAAVLLAAAIAAVIWANTPWSSAYDDLWSTELTVGVGSAQLTETLQHWVNDLAMALFFFVAGLEIKRELVHGELREPRTAALPIICALGGMVVPALLYAAFNAGGEGSNGWGIPMATDIAFALGVLSVVGRRVPATLKAFLLTLAIVDDIGAIAVIAVFYSAGINLTWLATALVAVGMIVGLRRLGVNSMIPYALVAALMWLAVFESGVHATIAGVVLALLTPARPLQDPAAAGSAATERLAAAHLGDHRTDEDDETTLLEVSRLTTDAVSPLARLERRIHPWTAFVVLPLFALANAGVDLTPPGGLDLASPVSIGIIVGLVVGKPLGVALAAAIAVRFAGVRLPSGVGWVELIGVGAVAGIGFTVSLFVTGLALDDHLQGVAKVAILAASILAAGVGTLLLLLRPASEPLTGGAEP